MMIRSPRFHYHHRHRRHRPCILVAVGASFVSSVSIFWYVSFRPVVVALVELVVVVVVGLVVVIVAMMSVWEVSSLSS